MTGAPVKWILRFQLVPTGNLSLALSMLKFTNEVSVFLKLFGSTLAAKHSEVEEYWRRSFSEELEDDVDSVTVQELKDYLLKDKGKLFNTKLLKIIFFIYSCIY